MELLRLGWQCEQEVNTCRHPSRARLGHDAYLLQCSDELLGQLQWGAAQGRQLLEQQFGKASRQQLSDEQLLQFNQLLEEQLLLNHA